MTAVFTKGMMVGAKGLQEAEAFIAAFPLSADRTRDTVLSTAAFDAWAEGQGYYTTSCEQATLLEARNRLKKKINVTASSPAWLAKNQTPFFIAVGQHGKSLKVQRVEDAFSIKAQSLPKQVKSYATTKRDAIRALLQSIDMKSLPPAWQMRIQSFDREIERYLRGLHYQTTELDREYIAIQTQLKTLVDAKLLESDEEIRAVIESNGVNENNPE
jgi:hypothetical protein